MTRRSLQRLRPLTSVFAAEDPNTGVLEVAHIELVHAHITSSPTLRTRAERVDSLMALLDWSALHSGRIAQQSIALAKAWEKLGEPKRALAAIGRYALWNTESMPYLGMQVREQGRLAALAGDRKRAVRSYRHYLGMRALAEPSLKPQVDSVRQELARVERDR